VFSKIEGLLGIMANSTFCSAKTSLRRPPATLARTGAPKTGDTLKARYDIVQQILLKSQ
jgi:hypothetical protein